MHFHRDTISAYQMLVCLFISFCSFLSKLSVPSAMVLLSNLIHIPNSFRYHNTLTDKEQLLKHDIQSMFLGKFFILTAFVLKFKTPLYVYSFVATIYIFSLTKLKILLNRGNYNTYASIGIQHFYILFLNYIPLIIAEKFNFILTHFIFTCLFLGIFVFCLNYNEGVLNKQVNIGNIIMHSGLIMNEIITSRLIA